MFRRAYYEISNLRFHGYVFSHMREIGGPCGIGNEKQQQYQTGELQAAFSFFRFPKFPVEHTQVRDGVTDAQPAAHAEQQTGKQADTSADVQEFPAVIPPADAPCPFQYKTRQVFQERAEYHGKEKDAHRLVFPAPEQQSQQDTPAAIDGQPGTGQNPPVDKISVCCQIDAGYPQPSEKGKKEKQ